MAKIATVLSGRLAPLMLACVLAPAGLHQGWAQVGGPAERQLLNPLSALDLQAFKGFRDKPIFAPSRQPLVSGGETELTDEPIVVYPDDEPLPNIRLVGVLQVSQARIALVEDLDALTTVSIQEGDSVGAWLVTSVDPASIVVANGDLEHEFALFQPGEAIPTASGDVTPGEDGEGSKTEPGVDENALQQP